MRQSSRTDRCRLEVGAREGIRTRQPADYKSAALPLRHSGRRMRAVTSLIISSGGQRMAAPPDIQCPRLESTSYEGPAEGTIRNSSKSSNQYRKLAHIKSRLKPGLSNERRAMPRVTVYYDGTCGLCKAAVKWMRKADWFRQVKWMPAQELDTLPEGLTLADLDEAMYLQDSRGRLYGGFFAVRRLALILQPLFPLAPLMWLPGARFLGVRLYSLIARNRGCFLGSATGSSKPPR